MSADQAASGKSSVTVSQGVYARQATGLVREVGTGGAILMALAVMSPPYALFIVTIAPEIAPGMNWPMIVILGALLAVPFAFLWGWLTQLMPRTGGDYIFVSRTLSGWLGFVASFTFQVFVVFSVTSTFATLAPLYIGAIFGAVGAHTHNATLVNIATALSGRTPSFLIGVGCIFVGLVIASLPLRLFTKLFAVLFPLGACGILLAVLVFATHSHSDLGSLLAQYHTSYGGVLAAAGKAGYHATAGFNLGADFVATAAVFGFMGFGYTSAYLGGEIRRPQKTVTRAYLSGIGIGVVGLLLLLGFAASSLGEKWIGAASYLATFDPKAYTLPVAPGALSFASLLTSNVPLIIVMNALVVFLVIISQGPAFFLTTRSMVAWSFDRVVPTRISEVNPRTHTPIFATVILFFVYVIVVAVETYGPSTVLALAFGGLLASLPVQMLVAVTAIVFPWLRPEVFKRAPLAVYRVAGVPVLSLVGIAALASYAWFFEQYFTNATLGANSPVVFVSFPVVVFIGAVVYVVSRYVRARQGIDLSVAYRELPPE